MQILEGYNCTFWESCNAHFQEVPRGYHACTAEKSLSVVNDSIHHRYYKQAQTQYCHHCLAVIHWQVDSCKLSPIPLLHNAYSFFKHGYVYLHLQSDL